MSTTISSTTAAAAAPAISAAAGANDAQDRFLKLLVTQLKNQDPLNPMDNAQITSQMAQISTVSGIDKLNTTLQTLAASMGGYQSLQEGTSLIGRSVLVSGSTLQLQNGSALGGVELPAAADKVVITIKDGSGQLLQTIDLGAQAAGVLGYQWDGVLDNGASAAPGSYGVAVNATVGASKIDATALTRGVVGSVTQGRSGVSLNVNGMGTVPLSSVKQVM